MPIRRTFLGCLLSACLLPSVALSQDAAVALIDPASSIDGDTSFVSAADVIEEPSPVFSSRFAQAPWENSVNLRKILGRTVLACLALVAVSLVLIVWGRARGLHRRDQRPVTSTMNLLSTMTLAPRCYLQLVSVNDQHFLVARDGTTVRCITPVASFEDSLDSLGDAEVIGDRTLAPTRDLTHDDAAALDKDAQSIDSRQQWLSSSVEPRSGEDQRTRDLPRSFDAGLSLETETKLGTPFAGNASIRRSDPWQGSLPTRR